MAFSMDTLMSGLGDKLSGAVEEAIMKKIMGGGGSDLTNGLSMLAGVMPPGLSQAVSLFGSYLGSRNSGRAVMSGVDPIFGSSPVVHGGDMSVLYGSGVFEKAAFSSRNAGGDVLRDFSGSRLGGEIKVTVKPSREFDAISEEKWVRSSVMNDLAGIPRRTNFNHG